VTEKTRYMLKNVFAILLRERGGGLYGTHVLLKMLMYFSTFRFLRCSSSSWRSLATDRKHILKAKKPPLQAALL